MCSYKYEVERSSGNKSREITLNLPAGAGRTGGALGELSTIMPSASARLPGCGVGLESKLAGREARELLDWFDGRTTSRLFVRTASNRFFFTVLVGGVATVRTGGATRDTSTLMPNAAARLPGWGSETNERLDDG